MTRRAAKRGAVHATLGFCGRAAETAVVAEALARARTGRPAVVVVTGGGGIGKSRLLREALAGVEPADQAGLAALAEAESPTRRRARCLFRLWSDVSGFSPIAHMSTWALSAGPPPLSRPRTDSCRRSPSGSCRC